MFKLTLMIINRLLLILIICCNCLLTVAQSRRITGKITDAATKGSLSGVSINFKGHSGGTVSDNDGSFSLNVNPNDLLIVSAIGFISVTIPVTNQVGIDIALQPSFIDLSQIVVVGSRSVGRIRTESTVPVDVIRINQAGLTTAKMDLTSQLNYTAPSFNYNKQSGADGADHIDLGTLRGLGPDQTLVLINGKRRHQTAFVALFGTRGRGNSGTDLNSFPEASVDRIEILRDGASAQYGSDAMAGVINLILKRDTSHWVAQAGYSGYYDTKFNPYKTRSTNEYYVGKPLDGNTFSFSVNNGEAIGKKGGFINVSFDFLTQGKTYRQVTDTNLQTNPQALPLNTLRRAFGDGSVTTGGAMYNMEVPMGNAKSTFYSFGGYNYKASDAYAYTRDQNNSTRFPIDNAGSIIFNKDIMRKNSSGFIYYNPHIITNIEDISAAVGIKGHLNSDWHWDLSNTIGRNDFQFKGDKTFNASLGLYSPNKFNDGGFNFLQNTTNLDFTKTFKNVASGLNLGLGLEYRYEKYGIYSGEEASYYVYPDSKGNPTGQAAGSQGFPGFRPSDEVNAHRTNLGGYIDAELDVTKNWLVDAAIRLENYSDFGFVNTYKLASRYKVTSNFNLRGSFSSGYRAPSLQQINFSNTLTTFVGTDLKEEKVARNNDPITKAAGIPKLKEETSINSSIGFSWKPITGLTLTTDAYLVKVKNRIVLSGLFSADDGTLPANFTDRLKTLNVALAQFFDNAVNTTNKGVDIVLEYNKKLNRDQGFKILIAGNIQNMTIDKVHVPDVLNDSYVHRKTFFSDREESFLKASAPKSKFSFNLEYDCKKWGIGTHITYFGDIKLLGFGYTGLASAIGTNGPGDPAILTLMVTTTRYMWQGKFMILSPKSLLMFLSPINFQRK
ncbi:MAG: TonB-dependent receptor [Ginsengibacter sp.]